MSRSSRISARRTSSACGSATAAPCRWALAMQRSDASIRRRGVASRARKSTTTATIAAPISTTPTVSGGTESGGMSSARFNHTSRADLVPARRSTIPTRSRSRASSGPTGATRGRRSSATKRATPTRARTSTSTRARTGARASEPPRASIGPMRSTPTARRGATTKCTTPRRRTTRTTTRT